MACVGLALGGHALGLELMRCHGGVPHAATVGWDVVGAETVQRDGRSVASRNAERDREGQTDRHEAGLVGPRSLEV